MRITGRKGTYRDEPVVVIEMSTDEARDLYVRLHEVPGDRFAEDVAFDLHAALMLATVTVPDARQD